MRTFTEVGVSRSDRIAGARGLIAGCELYVHVQQSLTDQDGTLPLLIVGSIHEWFVPPELGDCRPSRHSFTAARPITVALLNALHSLDRSRPGRWVFVGLRVIPYALAFAEGTPMARALDRAVFVDPANGRDRSFAVDAALRCPGVAVVIADGRGVDMALSRRFQLSAAAGNTLGVLLRPGCEIRELSAAATRWVVSPTPSPDDEPRWTVNLLRCKGMQPTTDVRRWTVRLDHATGDVRVVTDADGGSGAAERPAVLAGRSSEGRARSEAGAAARRSA